MPISFDFLRVGKKYFLENYGERFEFMVTQRKEGNNFLVKDLYTLEQYELKDLIKYGKGSDYELHELE